MLAMLSRPRSLPSNERNRDGVSVSGSAAAASSCVPKAEDKRAARMLARLLVASLGDTGIVSDREVRCRLAGASELLSSLSNATELRRRPSTLLLLLLLLLFELLALLSRRPRLLRVDRRGVTASVSKREKRRPPSSRSSAAVDSRARRSCARLAVCSLGDMGCVSEVLRRRGTPISPATPSRMCLFIGSALNGWMFCMASSSDVKSGACSSRFCALRTSVSKLNGTGTVSARGVTLERRPLLLLLHDEAVEGRRPLGVENDDDDVELGPNERISESLSSSLSPCAVERLRTLARSAVLNVNSQGIVKARGVAPVEIEPRALRLLFVELARLSVLAVLDCCGVCSWPERELLRRLARL